jgi:RNase P subunit RPR2
VHSDDLENDFNYSDEEMNDQEKKAPAKKRARKRPAQTYQQEVDTNVYKISMATLSHGVELASGDPVFCKNCQALFNSNSKAEDNKESGDEGQIWTCEFCYTKQEVNFEPEELPKSNTINYMLEAAAQVHEQKVIGKQETSVVFCIDISGSMCVS